MRGRADARAPSPAEVPEGHRPLPRRTVMTGNVAAQLPPPRPAVTSDIALPIGRTPRVAPASVRAAAGLWWTGCAAVVVGIVAAFLDRAALEARLSATATADDPTASAELVADGVRATMAVVAGSVTVLVLVSTVFLLLVVRGRSWARWALLVAVLPTVLALDIAQSVVAGGSDVDRWALVAGAGAFVVALLPLLARSARHFARGGARR
ncbi:hypothetical protein GCU56_19890 [Geodermatophilus sabuli]|uniref:Uncharacterized protein n=1 Tax=Geodermatophilus sabuli TaxID=1564158 RepID=A0A7K3W6W4_9ACTN|nr:hypothetical protein [Geodermatophilus sabuli]NEK60123.1 hypothetical protein [Geodermatophilus sabuli]